MRLVGARTVALAFLTLIACNEPAPLAQEEILARAQGLPKPDPGLYRTTTTLVDFSMSEPAAADTAWAQANMATGTRRNCRDDGFVTVAIR